MKIIFSLVITIFFTASSYARIPGTLKESLLELDNFLSEEEQENFLKYDEKSLILAYDMSLGNYVRNSWMYDEETPLYLFFVERCIEDLRQMSHIILISYHRMKSKKLIHLKGQVENLIGDKAFKKCKHNFRSFEE
jgi:Domain of unknown function (DUF6794)